MQKLDVELCGCGVSDGNVLLHIPLLRGWEAELCMLSPQLLTTSQPEVLCNGGVQLSTLCLCGLWYRQLELPPVEPALLVLASSRRTRLPNSGRQPISPALLSAHEGWGSLHKLCARTRIELLWPIGCTSNEPFAVR